MIHVSSASDDAPAFIAIVERLVQYATTDTLPAEVYLVEIKGCFDKKWERFSGVVDLQLGTWLGPYLRVPPFHPNRIVSQSYFHRADCASLGYRACESKPLHLAQSSYQNVHRRLRQITESALLVWYSSGSASSGQGTILSYEVAYDTERSFFCAFTARNGWKAARSRNISRRELEYLATGETLLTAPN